MSWKIQITRSKPNPTGKDKSNDRPISSRLLGEWADLKNIGDANVTLSTLHLAHSEFQPGCSLKEEASLYWQGTSTVTLKPAEVVRVHTGRSSDVALMDPADRAGVHYHSYAEKGNFVLNNDCGDNLSVWWQDSNQKWHRDDAAGYSPRPTEGKVLQRVGDRLV